MAPAMSRRPRLLSVLLLVLLMLAAACRKPDHSGLSDVERRTKIAELFAVYQDAFPAVTPIAPDEALRLYAEGRALFVDARDPAERRVSMLPEAMAWEEYVGDPARYSDRVVIAYCTVGYRSGVLAASLAKEGRARLFNLQGGVLGWLHSGGPVLGPDGRQTRRVHVYGPSWDLAPRLCEAVY